MAFDHESFWIAVATAAPVIAVANTVAITHAMDMYFGEKSLPKSRWRGWFLLAICLSASNFGLQTVALYDALRSLLIGKDAAPANYVIWYEVIGLFAVIVVLFCEIQARFVSHRNIQTSGSKARMNR